MGGHKFDMLKHQIKGSGFQMFLLSESWLTEATPNKVVEIEGFDTIRGDRAWRDDENMGKQEPKRGGGLLCYIKEGIKYSDSKFRHLNTSCKDLEMLWIKLSLENVRPIIVVNIYRPPQGSYLKCCELISNAFEKADLKDNTDIFMMGDFSINFDDKTSPGFKELDFTTKSLGLNQLIESPTRSVFRDGIITENRIDLIFSNSEHVADSKTLDFNISDHLGIMVTRKKTPVKVHKIDFKGRSYKNYTKEVFQENLLNSNWEDFFNNDDPNWLWDFMYKTILANIEPMCPMKSFKVAGFKEPWMTNEAIEAIKDKDRALNRAKRTKNAEDWEQAKRVRNRVGRDIENLRADYLKNQQEAHKTDPKKFWKSIVAIFPGKKEGQAGIWLKTQEGKNIDPNDTAGYINSFFTNIGPELAKNYKGNWNYFGETVQDSIEGISTELGEVTKLSREIEVMKASGMDRLSSRICKDAFMVLGQQLTYLFNCSVLSMLLFFQRLGRLPK